MGFYKSLFKFILIFGLILPSQACDVMIHGSVNNDSVYSIELPEGSIRISTSLFGGHRVALECNGTYLLRPSFIECRSSGCDAFEVLVYKKYEDILIKIKDDCTITDDVIILNIIPSCRKLPRDIELNLTNCLLVNGRPAIQNSLSLAY